MFIRVGATQIVNLNHVCEIEVRESHRNWSDKTLSYVRVFAVRAYFSTNQAQVVLFQGTESQCVEFFERLNEKLESTVITVN